MAFLTWSMKPSVLNCCILFSNKLSCISISKLSHVSSVALCIVLKAAFHNNKFKSFMVPYCLSHHNWVVFQPSLSKLKRLWFHHRESRLLNTEDKIVLIAQRWGQILCMPKLQHIYRGREPRPQAEAPAGDGSITRHQKNLHPSAGEGRRPAASKRMTPWKARSAAATRHLRKHAPFLLLTCQQLSPLLSPHSPRNSHAHLSPSNQPHLLGTCHKPGFPLPGHRYLSEWGCGSLSSQLLPWAVD